VSKEQKVHNVGKSETPLTAVSENRRWRMEVHSKRPQLAC
jgi:hypothetical protein